MADAVRGSRAFPAHARVAVYQNLLTREPRVRVSSLPDRTLTNVPAASKAATCHGQYHNRYGQVRDLRGVSKPCPIRLSIQGASRRILSRRNVK